MPVVNVMLPLGSTTTATECGDCPHLRAGCEGYITKQRRWCRLFADLCESDDDGTSYITSWETTLRCETCRMRTAGAVPE